MYLPPGYDDTDRRYPSVYVLQGFTGAVPGWKYRTNNFRPTYPEMADELFATGGAPPCIVVFVDAWTSLGGSQFVDSPGTGRYHTYLCEDVVAFVDAAYRTLDDPAHRGVQGKSSGGFGAMITAMMRPDLFGGLATHAGDAFYEYCYLPGLADAYRALRDHYDSSFEVFFADMATRAALSRPTDGEVLMAWAIGACFSAEEDGTVRVPFDLRTRAPRRGGLGALAGLGSRQDGPAPRAGPALAAGDLGRRRAAPTTTASISAPRPSSPSWPRSG